MAVLELPGTRYIPNVLIHSRAERRFVIVPIVTVTLAYREKDWSRLARLLDTVNSVLFRSTRTDRMEHRKMASRGGALAVRVLWCFSRSTQ